MTEAEKYIEENNIQKNCYAIEKAFRDGMKKALEEVEKSLPSDEIIYREYPYSSGARQGAKYVRNQTQEVINKLKP